MGVLNLRVKYSDALGLFEYRLNFSFPDNLNYMFRYELTKLGYIRYNYMDVGIT